MAAGAELSIIISAQDRATATLGRIEKQLQGLERTVERTSGAWRTMANIAGGIQLSGVISRIEDLGVSAIKTGIGFDAMKEQAQLAFTTMLQSGTRAQIFLDQLQAFATKTPFEFPGLIKAAQRLMAMGFAAGEVIPTMTALGNAVAGLGGSEEVLNRVITAIGQMRAKGVVSAEEMRQLTEAGISAWENLATAIGVTVPEAMKKVEQRSISASVGIKAQLDGINKKYTGLMDAQSRTFNGMFSNIKDLATQASGRVFEPLFLKAKEGMEGLLGVTGSPEWETNLDKIELGIFGIVRAIETATEKTVGWLDKIKDIANSDVFKTFAAFTVGIPLTGLRATGLVGGAGGGGGGGGGEFKGVSDFQLRENELRGRVQLQERLRRGEVSQEELLILEQMSIARAQETKALNESKNAFTEIPPVVKDTTDALRDFQEAMGNAVQGFLGLDAIKSAVSALFGKPTREQADLKLFQAEQNVFKARFGEKAVHFGPGEGPGTLARTEKQLKVLQSEEEVQKARIEAANSLLLTEQQRAAESEKLRDLTEKQSNLIRDKLMPSVTDLFPEINTAATAFQTIKGILTTGPDSVAEALKGFARDLSTFKLPEFKDPNTGQTSTFSNAFQGP